MKTAIKNYLSLASLIIFFFLAVASSKNGAYSDAKNWIPADFNPNKMTLLIEEHPLNKKQNERMIKFIQDNYPYSYEVVDAATIKSTSGKYSDTRKYQFGILWTSSTSSYTTVSTDGRPSTNYAWDMWGHFIDRSSGKEYPSTTKSNVYGQIGYRPVINAIVKQFKTN